MNALPSNSPSNNRKSAIQNPKWLGLSLNAFVLVVVVGVAEAQQLNQTARIGILQSVPRPPPRRAWWPFVRVCESLVMWKVRT
jgi:hypothetical protein